MLRFFRSLFDYSYICRLFRFLDCFFSGLGNRDYSGLSRLSLFFSRVSDFYLCFMIYFTLFMFFVVFAVLPFLRGLENVLSW
jgi:hypothetical protein